MQEPNIPPLFQTIPKAESPLSFLEMKHPPEPFAIRVIIGTAPTCYDRIGNSFPKWEVMRDFY
jgi:hypothetical protein